MSRRETCVRIHIGIECAPSVTVVADDGDFERLAFAIRASDEIHALVSSAVEMERQSLATRRMSSDTLFSLLRESV